MHCNNIRVVNATNAKSAVDIVKDYLETDESLTSNNWWSVVGVLNLNTEEYTQIAKDYGEDKNLQTIKGIKKIVKDIANKERYERLQLDLMCAIKLEDWDTVRISATELEDIKAIVKKGFKFSYKGITELAPCRVDTFSITDMREDNKGQTFAVILDFHF